MNGRRGDWSVMKIEDEEGGVLSVNESDGLEDEEEDID